MRTPPLRRVAAVPALLSAILFGFLAVLSLMFGGTVLGLLWQAPEAADSGMLLRVAYWSVRVLSSAFLIALSGVLALLGSMVIAQPFLDVLSERTDRALGVETRDEPFSLGNASRDLALATCEIGMDLSALVVGHVGLLFLHLVPIVGTVAHPVLGFLLSTFFAGLEVTGPALARRGVRGTRRWRVLRGDLWRSVGLGAGVLLVLLVPLAQLLTLPIAVVAGTLTVLDWERQGRLEAGGGERQRR